MGVGNRTHRLWYFLSRGTDCRLRLGLRLHRGPSCTGHEEVPRPGVKDRKDHSVDTGRNTGRDGHLPETPMDLDHAQQFVRGKSGLRPKTREELRIGHERRTHHRWGDQTLHQKCRVAAM
jgi:hypothetical protein